MQYLVSVIDEDTGSAIPTEMAGMDALNEQLQAEDQWIFAHAGHGARAGR
jgi:hypothetical protein